MKIKPKPFHFMLPSRLYNLAMRSATKRYLSLAAWVREAIEEKLTREDNRP